MCSFADVFIQHLIFFSVASFVIHVIINPSRCPTGASQVVENSIVVKYRRDHFFCLVLPPCTGLRGNLDGMSLWQRPLTMDQEVAGSSLVRKQPTLSFLCLGVVDSVASLSGQAKNRDPLRCGGGVRLLILFASFVPCILAPVHLSIA